LQADDDAQQARLAGARRPDKADKLALAYLKACALQDRLAAAVGERDI
jgi:hypothetical protein